MEISYDKEADALYIRLRNNEFDHNKKVDDYTILDLDKDNRVIGIEVIDASKNVPTLSEIHVKNITLA